MRAWTATVRREFGPNKLVTRASNEQQSVQHPLLAKQSVGRTQPELLTSPTPLATAVGLYACFQAVKFAGCPMRCGALHCCCCLLTGTTARRGGPRAPAFNN